MHTERQSAALRSLEDVAPRPALDAVLRGLRSRCPACGEGPLFAKNLKTHDHCPSCGEELHHHRADDLPAYLNIFVTGHVVVGAMMMVMALEILGMWTLTAATIAVGLVAAIALMRPLKGMVVGLQWALRMHGFGGDES